MAQMNANQAGPRREKSVSSRQGRRGSDFSLHQAVTVQAGMRLRAEALLSGKSSCPFDCLFS